ncbi:MAG: hypothetical protein KDD47_16070, partial [Acidobacteria bacterium]|nr:hypothetical protein [Acidobacteriota bacterium]
PQLVLVSLAQRGLGEPEGDASLLAMFGLLLPLLALTQVQAGLVAPGVARALRGETVSAAHCLPRSGAALARILLGAALVALAASLGFLFFLLPGWVVLTGLFIALPATVLEDLSPLAALRLSWNLTALHWLPLFALVFMFTVLERILSLALTWSGLPPLAASLPAIPISALQAVTAGVAYHRLRTGGVEAEEPAHPEMPDAG